MDGFGFLVILIAVIVSIIGEAGKKKGPQAPPPTRRPAPRPRAEPRPLPRPAPPRETAESSGSAAEMIPDDFWRELTGQAPREPSTPEPLPAEPLSWDEEAVATAEAENRALQKGEVTRSWDEYRRPEIVRRAPPITNYETSMPTVAQRHTAFHRKYDAPQATPAPRAPVAKADSLMHRLRSRGTAREGVIFAEIFGSPKGLEQDRRSR